MIMIQKSCIIPKSLLAVPLWSNPPPTPIPWQPLICSLSIYSCSFSRILYKQSMQLLDAGFVYLAWYIWDLPMLLHVLIIVYSFRLLSSIPSYGYNTVFIHSVIERYLFSFFGDCEQSCYKHSCEVLVWMCFHFSKISTRSGHM